MFNINFNLIVVDNCFVFIGLRTQGQALSLRVVAIFQCDFSRELHIILTIDGGSKPPPYHVVVCTVSFATAFGCLSLTIQLLLFRKNHARLACSVVNALTTARCRYQLLRFADRACPCSYGLWVYFNMISIKKESLFRLSFNVLFFNCSSAFGFLLLRNDIFYYRNCTQPQLYRPAPFRTSRLCLLQ